MDSISQDDIFYQEEKKNKADNYNLIVPAIQDICPDVQVRSIDLPERGYYEDEFSCSSYYSENENSFEDDHEFAEEDHSD
jgi:hypothetical protein